MGRHRTPGPNGAGSAYGHAVNRRLKRLVRGVHTNRHTIQNGSTRTASA